MNWWNYFEKNSLISESTGIHSNMHLRWDQIVRLKLKMRRWKSTKLASEVRKNESCGEDGNTIMKHPKSCHEGLCFVISGEDDQHQQSNQSFQDQIKVESGGVGGLCGGADQNGQLYYLKPGACVTFISGDKLDVGVDNDRLSPTNLLVF